MSLKSLIIGILLLSLLAESRQCRSGNSSILHILRAIVSRRRATNHNDAVKTSLLSCMGTTEVD